MGDLLLLFIGFAFLTYAIRLWSAMQKLNNQCDRHTWRWIPKVGFQCEVCGLMAGD